MFTETLSRRVRRSALVGILTGPHGVDRYTEVFDRTWTVNDARAKVVAVRRQTPRSVTLTLQPNDAWQGFKAGQHINLTVEIDGRRRTRCYSPANSEGSPVIELTVGLHDGGLVSTHLFEHAEPGMVVHLDSVGGDFVLPEQRPRRILLVSGGSGITPVLSMLRTLREENFDGEVAFVHYARNPEEAAYATELAATPGVKVLHSYTRSNRGDLSGHFGPDHLAAAMPNPDAVFVCGPPALVDAVKDLLPGAQSESFVPPVIAVPTEASGGSVAFTESKVDVVDDGRSILEQAEAAGLNPTNGCRMGICHTCTRKKISGPVKNLITGAVSTAPDENIEICVTAPCGDVQIDL
ncbi:MAG: ferredoxin reductase [Mycolicibacterium sp.]|uniref:ferredoxin reductase n=1 Tax=Mycolicibacterium sp. TaxID=2320850 RepID=UPI00092C1E91|nr:ferredoxin reductase [Mycolicibacterium sp.]RUP34820.1 MAG: ferredoxin reductase [Mycolicibacterium sp.]SHV37401.1 flavodoxin reductase family protein [Mycobacteroides abscessus subsp. abscessus]